MTEYTGASNEFLALKLGDVLEIENWPGQYVVIQTAKTARVNIHGHEYPPDIWVLVRRWWPESGRVGKQDKVAGNTMSGNNERFRKVGSGSIEFTFSGVDDA